MLPQSAIAAALCWLLPCVALAQGSQTLTLQPDPVEGRDTFLGFDGSANNFGASDYLEGYSNFHRAILISFDLSSVPAGSTCVSADLLFRYREAEPDATAGRTWTVYELLHANAGWVEGTGNFTPAAPGESSRIRRVAPSQQWASGNPVLGFEAADVNPSPVATTTLPGIPVSGDELYFVLPCATVVPWFGSGPSNPGLVLTVDDVGLPSGAHRLYSSDAINPTQRPLFSVTFVPPPPPDGGGGGSDGGTSDGGSGGPPTGDDDTLLRRGPYGIGCACTNFPGTAGPWLAMWFVGTVAILQRRR